MSLRTVPFLVAAGVDNFSVMDVTGTLLAIREASAAFDLQVDGGAAFQLVERGDKFPRRTFKQLKIINKTTTALAGVFVIGDGEWEDYRPLTRPTGPTRGKTLWSGAITAAALVPATAPLVELSDTSRFEIGVQCPAGNVAAIALSSAQSAAQYFALVNPGQVSRFIWSGPVYLIGSNAADNANIYGAYY